MKREKKLIDDETHRLMQANRLEEVLSKLVENLQEGRNHFFDIAEDLQTQCLQLETDIENINQEIADIIRRQEEQEQLEKAARWRLMEVSRDFKSFTETDIKEAYTAAQAMQLELINLRQEELYIRKQRDNMLRQLKQFRSLAAKADQFINNTGLALKILQGNVERISESVEDAYRKQQVQAWILQSQESERRKIARELHDGPSQSLASALIRLELVDRLDPKDQEQIKKENECIKDMCRESLSDIRRIMFDLRPTLVHDKGLAYTLKEFFSDYEVKYNFNIEFVVFGRIKKYDLSLEMALFRLVQEAITNVRKHAGTNRVLVKLEDNDGLLTLVVKDEGTGFDPDGVAQAGTESYGILGMKERVQLLGGEIEIISAKGMGTQVIIKLPVEGEDKNCG
ncbi:MAG: sensor histidine kinase [Syntrophomonadaceae bacterium]|jgi:two-component system sensor histidine kinase DegS